MDGAPQHTRLWGQISSPLGENTRGGKDAVSRSKPGRQMSPYERAANGIRQRESAEQQMILIPSDIPL